MRVPSSVGCFADTHSPGTSIALVTDRLLANRTTEAEVCTAFDRSCPMHVAGGLARERSGRPTPHRAEIVNSAAGTTAS